MSDMPRPDREAEVYKRFVKRAVELFDGRLTPELIEEHRRAPLGPKSRDLLHLLDFLRQAPMQGKLAVYALKPGEYQIIRLSGESGVANDMSDPARFGTEDEALHEVFLRRLAELGLVEHKALEPGEPTWPRGEDPHLIGYTDRLDARPAETVRVSLSADRPVEARVELVRLGVGDPNGDVRESSVQEWGVVNVKPQSTRLGSSAHTEPLGELAEQAHVLGLTVMITAPHRGAQLVAGQRDDYGVGWGLVVRGGRLSLEEIADQVHSEIASTEPLNPGVWYSVAIQYAHHDPVLAVRPVNSALAPTVRVPNRGTNVVGIRPITLNPDHLHLAAWPSTDGRMAFNGRIESPFLSASTDPGGLADSRAQLVSPREISNALAVWEPATALAGGVLAGQLIPAVVKTDDGWTERPDLAASCVNTPTWGVTSSAWDGTEHDFRRRPEHWAAIHFHDDDIDDAEWETTCTIELPTDLSSGPYGIKVTGETGHPERLPLFVEPRDTTRTIAVIIPTASYVAYANDHPGTQAQMAQATASRTPVLLDGDLFMHDHPELGRSCYDTHSDGSGVGYASLRRPLLNMRPTHRYHVGAWQLPADLRLLSWLNDEGIAFDVITDHTLHSRGVEALKPYRVVMTTSHSEYYSTPMLDAVTHYVGDGGRLLYLGANGFYWRVAFDPKRPWVMELRRGENGSRAWQSLPGELHHVFTGERGGLWANLGRPSYAMFGVGFSSQGFDGAGWYRKLSDADDPRAAFIFEGVGAETFGHHGTTGGAAGQEVDRYDLAHGTPPDTLLLATSEGLSEGYLRTVEDIYFMVAGTSASVDHKVRADMTYLVRPGGGAVFCTGSIAWCQSLGIDKDVSRITRNVIERFDTIEPLQW